jgi:hypothetical protein
MHLGYFLFIFGRRCRGQLFFDHLRDFCLSYTSPAKVNPLTIQKKALQIDLSDKKSNNCLPKSSLMTLTTLFTDQSVNSASLVMSLMYPYGAAAGDFVGGFGNCYDGGSTAIKTPTTFWFFGTSYSNIYVSMSQLLSTSCIQVIILNLFALQAQFAAKSNASSLSIEETTTRKLLTEDH